MIWRGLWSRLHGKRPAASTAFIGVVLLVISQHAADLPAATAHATALDHAWRLFQKVQNELGPKSEELEDAGSRVALGLSETRRDAMRHSEWLRAQWFYYLLHDDHARARDAIAASRDAALKAGAGPDWVATVTNELSYSLILLGEVAKAKEYLREAIVLASQRNNPSILTDQYYSMADAYRKTGEPSVARRYFAAAHELDLATGDKSRQVGSELRLGSIARDAGAIEEAVRRHERALAEFHHEGNFREITAQLELASDCAALRNFDRAEALAIRAYRDRRSLVEQRLEASILLLKIANDRRVAGIGSPADEVRVSKLIREIDGIITRATSELGSEFSHPTRQLEFYEQAIRHYALGDDLEEVEVRGRRAIRLVQHVAAGLKATDDDVLAWLSSAQPLLDEYVNALYRLDRAQVFPLLETYYTDVGTVGAQRHSSVVARAFETEAVEVFERYRTAQRRVVNATAEADRLAGFASAEARDKIKRLDIDQLLFQRDLARDAYLAMRTVPPIPARPAAQHAARFQMPAVPATDVFVRYFVQDQVSFGVVLAGGQLSYFELPRRPEIITMIQRALGVIANPPSGEVERTPLSDLAKLLPPDLVERHSSARRLVIVADDAMEIAPFGAIDIGKASQPYTPLAARFELVRAKSAERYYGPTAVDDSDTTSDVVIFADPMTKAQPAVGVRPSTNAVPSWATRLPGLPNASRAGEVIANFFKGRTARSYLGAEATSEALLSDHARNAKVLHIATHGYFNRATPDLVGLVTSPTADQGRWEGGFVGLTELFTKPFASRLVVISGCESMRGMDYRGWSSGSLADGFLTQGAGSVIGMLWKVADDATATLMIAFYRELSRNGGNSSLALHQAQRELMESGFFRHPYYWAGVVLESSNRSIDQKVF